jgi:hypothetical protein
MDFRNNPKATARGLRNNNPFNLVKTAIQWQGKVKGTDSRFETFATVQQGIRAGVLDIVGDIGNKKLDTINKLITVYAPRFENDTNAYINYVSKVAGVDPNEKLLVNNKIDFGLLAKLVTGIINKENGPEQAQLIPSSVITAGITSALNNPTAKKFIGLTAPVPGQKNAIQKDYTSIILILLVSGLILSTLIK